jgi:hypothetical protein
LVQQVIDRVAKDTDGKMIFAPLGFLFLAATPLPSQLDEPSAPSVALPERNGKGLYIASGWWGRPA